MDAPTDQTALDSAHATNGVLTSRQLLELGVAEATIRRRVRSGAWVRIQPAVYLVEPKRILEVPTIARAALLAGPKGAVASHLLAGHLYGLDGLPDLVRAELTAPIASGRHNAERLIVHRTAAVDIAETRQPQGFSATSPTRTLADVAARCADWQLLAALDSSLRRRLVTTEELADTARLWAGRAGADRLRRMVRLAQQGSDSAFESRFRLALHDGGLPTPELQIRVTIGRFSYRIDLGWRRWRIGIELDGRAFHSSAQAVLEDRRRQNTLLTEGWLILRFTWDDLVHRPEQVIAAVRSALAARATWSMEA
jgi:very-short-patch-repair endonuclease